MQRTRRSDRRFAPLPARPRHALWLAALPVGLALMFSMLPAAEAGQLAFPIRRPAAGVTLRATGPAATAYPYTVGAAPALDAYGFVTGQCTSFVAWWLNGRGMPFGVVTMGPGGTGWFLNASTWDAAARKAGYAFGARPVVGAIAQWHAGESSGRRDADGSWHTIKAAEAGHVAVVVRVLPDGQVDWLDYGFGGHPVLHRGSGFAPRYLYLGVAPPTA